MLRVRERLLWWIAIRCRCPEMAPIGQEMGRDSPEGARVEPRLNFCDLETRAAPILAAAPAAELILSWETGRPLVTKAVNLPARKSGKVCELVGSDESPPMLPARTMLALSHGLIVATRPSAVDYLLDEIGAEWAQRGRSVTYPRPLGSVSRGVMRRSTR